MKNKNILVIAAHPDDEILGCGGTISKHIDNEDTVNVLIMADGESSRTTYSESLVQIRNEQAKKASKVLGCSPYIINNFPDNRMDSIDLIDIVKSIEGVVFDLKPEIIYTHYVNDLNIDHQIVSKAVQTVCRPQPGFFVKQILQWETPSSTEWAESSENRFQPNWYVDISSYLEKKMEALNCYDSEMRPWPHSRSYEAVKYLAHWRGASVGVQAAECFKLVRNLC